MDILRFITAGNVDDGKSTLIGRLLYDTKNIKSDVLQSVSVHDDINLAHITDGLRSEREQGITIDVAYKYFTTPHRKYIITDAPGHFQYTKNLVTGASSVDAIIILIDAQNGITEQTRRHSLVASFLRIKQIVVAINKMDAMDYDQKVFDSIKREYIGIAEQLQLHNVTFIPISALCGDNVSFASERMGWYNGMRLMQYLDSCEPVCPSKDIARFSVQYVIEKSEEKGYAGMLVSGSFKVNDVVSVNPNLPEDITIITKIVCGNIEALQAKAGENVCLYFSNVTAAQRGTLISHFYNAPKYNDQFDATICWLDTVYPMQTGKEYILRIGAMETVCMIMEVVSKIDVTTFEKYNDEKMIEVNQFANVRIETKDKIAYDSFAELPENGRGVIIDIQTNYTACAFVIK